MRPTPWIGAALCAPLLLFLLGAFLVPLAGLVPASVGVDADRQPASSGTATGEDGSSAWAHYHRAVTSPLGLRALRNSLVLSTAVSLLSLILCLPPAWMLARYRFRGAALLRTVLALPLTFSGVIVGFLGILILGRLGLLPAVLELLTGRRLLAGSAYTLGGLVAAYVYFEVPRATLTLEAALAHIPDELGDAAATLGAGAWKRFVLVDLPLLRPALASTLAVTFAASMGSFGVALILARRFTVVPLEIYTELTAFLDLGYAAALCLLLAAATLVSTMTLRRAGRVAWHDAEMR